MGRHRHSGEQCAYVICYEAGNGDAMGRVSPEVERRDEGCFYIDASRIACHDRTEIRKNDLRFQQCGRHPVPYMAAHGSAKAALEAFVKYVALESAPYGVTANIVSPGLVETEASSVTPEAVKQQLAAMTPMQRVALPDDLSGAIAFFAGEESRFVTGSCMKVNGGIHMD